MSRNPYTPSDNWNDGVPPRRSGGVPGWALVVACLSTLALGGFAGLAGGLAIGFVMGETTSGAMEEWLENYDSVPITAIARVAEDGLSIEVLISNNSHDSQYVTGMDLYHSLVEPSNVVASSPEFTGTEEYPADDPDDAYTEYDIGDVVIPPGGWRTVTFTLRAPLTQGVSGDVDVWWNDETFVTSHVHFGETPRSSRREPEY